jgi:hypothetical protein
MTKFTTNDHFIRAVTAVAIFGPLLVLMICGTLPEGLARGQLIVLGYSVIVAALTAAVVLRAVYGLGFSKAFKLAAATSHRSFSAEQAA